MGDDSPSGWINSILLFGSSTKTVVTPWSGNGTGPETTAPSVSRYSSAAPSRSGTAMAT